jgi:hypothetical protein
MYAVTSCAVTRSFQRGWYSCRRYNVCLMLIRICVHGRFCSPSCVQAFKSAQTDSSNLPSPASSQGISLSSQASEVDAHDLSVSPAPVIGIPVSIEHFRAPRSRDDVWKIIHVLKKPLTIKEKKYTHICLVCAETKTWKRALCCTANTSNAKNHIILTHPDHQLAGKERENRGKRSAKFLETENAGDLENKRPVPGESSGPDTKRQKRFWHPMKAQLSGLIARWLIHDGAQQSWLLLQLTSI